MAVEQVVPGGADEVEALTKPKAEVGAITTPKADVGHSLDVALAAVDLAVGAIVKANKAGSGVVRNPLDEDPDLAPKFKQLRIKLGKLERFVETTRNNWAMSKDDNQLRELLLDIKDDGWRELEGAAKCAITLQKTLTTHAASQKNLEQQVKEGEAAQDRADKGLMNHLKARNEADCFYTEKERLYTPILTKMAQTKEMLVQKSKLVQETRAQFEQKRMETQAAIVKVQPEVLKDFTNAFKAIDSNRAAEVLAEAKKKFPIENDKKMKNVYKRVYRKMLLKHGPNNPTIEKFLQSMQRTATEITCVYFKHFAIDLHNKGLECSLASVKGIDRTLEKTSQYFQLTEEEQAQLKLSKEEIGVGDFRKVHDLARMTIVCDATDQKELADQIGDALDAIQSNPHIKVLWLEDYQLLDKDADVEWNSGYRHISMQVQIADLPLVAEIQVNTTEFLRIKWETKSHTVFEAQRGLQTWDESLTHQRAAFSVNATENISCGFTTHLDLDFTESGLFGNATNLRDDFVRSLASETCRLQHINFRGCIVDAISEENFRATMERSEGLLVHAQEIDLTLNPFLTDAAMSSVVRACPNIRVLHVQESVGAGELEQLFDSNYLPNLESLERIEAEECGLIGTGLSELIDGILLRISGSRCILQASPQLSEHSAA
jgi:hypothetical protein